MSVKQIKYSSNISTLSDTKLYAVLSQFSVYELNRLGKFVRSPYFNKNEALTGLLELIDSQLRQKAAGEISRSEAWQSVLPGQEYDDSRFRKLCSDLLKLIERYLIQEEFEKNDLQKANSLLMAIYNRKTKALYNSSLSTAKRLSEQYHFRPASYYFYEYSFERNYYNIAGLEIERTKEANIDQMAENLDRFYVAEKLRCYCIMLDRQKVASHDYRVLFIDEIISHIESGNLKDILPINLYYQVYLTQKEPDVHGHFATLKSLINQHLVRLPQMEAYEVLDSALNYCVSQVNMGKHHYLRDYMELSLKGVQTEVLLVNGAISPWTFRNVVFAGLRIQDYDWVEKFITKYQHQIAEPYRENAVSFNLASLHFYRKNYGDVLNLLQSVEYDDPSYNRNSKVMLLLTYYELEETESLLSLLASFELYLRRNKDIPEVRKVTYLNLIKFLRTLTRIANADTGRIQKLRDKVQATNAVVNKAWLLEKIDQLL